MFTDAGADAPGVSAPLALTFGVLYVPVYAVAHDVGRFLAAVRARHGLLVRPLYNVAHRLRG